MAKYSTALELFWNKSRNGGEFFDVVRIVDDTEYVWSLNGLEYNCSVLSFLELLNKYNFSCYPIVSNMGLSEEVLSGFSVPKKELEVYCRCPHCGKYHFLKLRSIRRKHSFVCSNCQEKYGGSKPIGYPFYIKERFPEIRNYWGVDNRQCFDEYVVYLSEQSISLVCPRCKGSFTKEYVSVNRSGAFCPTCARVISSLQKSGSLRDANPKIADMWDGGNNKYDSTMIGPGSGEEGYFLCKGRGTPHVFRSAPYIVMDCFKKSGTSYGCPICSNKKFKSGVNDFISTFPEYVDYWDYNSGSKPEDFCCTNESVAPIVCPTCGKRYERRVDHIKNYGVKCRVCTSRENKADLSGSLKMLHPRVAKMWDDGKNSISSDKLLPGSGERGTFLCTNGGKPHTFEKVVSAMVAADKKGNLGCPICSGFQIVEGINDFKSRQPNKVKYWDYEKNTVDPSTVGWNSEEKFYFKCPNGHSFKADPSHLRRYENTTGCPYCSGHKLAVGEKDLATMCPWVLKYWDYELNEFKPGEVSAKSNKYAWFKCTNCGKSYKQLIYAVALQGCCHCEDCRHKNYSKAEKEICEMIKSWGFEVEEGKNILGGSQTFDIYVPSKRLAIEYNGLYWHSEKIRPDPEYHVNKLVGCAQNNIDLLYIWEDEYRDKKDIVVRMLKNKLGISDDEKVNARDCAVQEIDYDLCSRFLDLYHIQGKTSGTWYVGLIEEDCLAAVGVFEKYEETDVLLKRYCTSCSVRGGFSKIISYIEKKVKPTGIYTFSDNCISDGSLYKNNGFVAVGSVTPDYKYLVGGTRKHKFNYRKDRFKTDPTLEYEEGLTESELAELNNLTRVYDAGKIKWYKDVKEV